VDTFISQEYNTNPGFALSLSAIFNAGYSIIPTKPEGFKKDDSILNSMVFIAIKLSKPLENVCH
jgi:hypothetical protein